MAGEVHPANAPVSSLHSNVTPASVSENVNVALVEATVPVGPESIVGSGGATVSTVQLRVVVVEVFPTESLARTSNECARPRPSPVVAAGVVQTANGSAS